MTFTRLTTSYYRRAMSLSTLTAKLIQGQVIACMVPELRRKASLGKMGMRRWGIQSGTQSRSRPRDCKRRAFGTKSLDHLIWEDVKTLRPASQETSLAYVKTDICRRV